MPRPSVLNSAAIWGKRNSRCSRTSAPSHWTLEMLSVPWPAGVAALFDCARAVYTSPEILTRERERIFSREWICIGRASAIASPGDI